MCPWGTFVSADSLRRFFELAKGHIWQMRVLHANASLEETYRSILENIELITRFSCFVVVGFFFFIGISVQALWA